MDRSYRSEQVHTAMSSLDVTRQVCLYAFVARRILDGELGRPGHHGEARECVGRSTPVRGKWRIVGWRFPNSTHACRRAI